MRMPSIYTALEIQKYPNSVFIDDRRGYIPARPIGFNCYTIGWFRRRFKLAWKVFIGTYDVLNWEDIEPDNSKWFTGEYIPVWKRKDLSKKEIKSWYTDSVKPQEKG